MLPSHYLSLFILLQTFNNISLSFRARQCVIAQWANWFFDFCLYVWASCPNFTKRKFSSHCSQILFAGSTRPTRSSPTFSPSSPPPPSSPVAASTSSTWVLSTKIYTDKLSFVTKLGLGPNLQVWIIYPLTPISPPISLVSLLSLFLLILRSRSYFYRQSS